MATKITKLLIVPALLMVLLSFSAFTTLPAHAAPASSQAPSGAKPMSCAVVVNVTTYVADSLYLMENVCYGTYYAEIVANWQGSFEVSLYQYGYQISYNSGYLYPGGYITTLAYSGYSSEYTAGGNYDG